MKKATAVAVVLLFTLMFVPALFAQTETPEKFKPLVRKWEWTENPSYSTRFEIFSVGKDGNAIVKYTRRAEEIPTKGTASIDEAGKLHLVLNVTGKIATVRWELEYYPKGKGMLFGKVKSSNYPDPSDVKVYPESR